LANKLVIQLVILLKLRSYFMCEVSLLNFFIIFY